MTYLAFQQFLKVKLTHLFKVDTSVGFAHSLSRATVTFIQLAHVHRPERALSPLAVTQFPRGPQPLAATRLLSVSVGFPVPDISQKRNHTKLTFLIRLLSLAVMFARFIQVLTSLRASVLLPK